MVSFYIITSFCLLSSSFERIYLPASEIKVVECSIVFR
jgi:hypothetical protein